MNLAKNLYFVLFIFIDKKSFLFLLLFPFLHVDHLFECDLFNWTMSRFMTLARNATREHSILISIWRYDFVFFFNFTLLYFQLIYSIQPNENQDVHQIFLLFFFARINLELRAFSLRARKILFVF